MVKVTQFLLKWLYLNDLSRRQESILPLLQENYERQQQEEHYRQDVLRQQQQQQQQQQYYNENDLNTPPPPPPPPPPEEGYYHDNNNKPPPPYSISTASSTRSNYQHDPYNNNNNNNNRKNVEQKEDDDDDLDSWKMKCLNCLAYMERYSPRRDGYYRLAIIETFRVNAVKDLITALKRADHILGEYGKNRRRTEEEEEDDDDDDDDLFADADEEIIEDILKAFEDGQGTMDVDNDDDDDNERGEARAILEFRGVIDKKEKNDNTGDTNTNNNSNEEYDEEYLQKISQAQSLLLESREYLPQLVSSVLHSPRPPLPTTTTTPDPISTLRRLLIHRCVIDPSLGIELCWLLEAELGKGWKKLFEQKQRTGRRLIIVAPAERAMALAEIGMEKRVAFEWLQEAELATAYGFVDGEDGEGEESWLEALSRMRCSHFGDSMQFVVELTELSLFLRSIPALRRNDYLKEGLGQLNRRIRRRMATRGQVSLDVKDNYGPNDWPLQSDITLDMLKYSVHLPLEPKSIHWTGGLHTPPPPSSSSSSTTIPTSNGVVRVLNIVTSDCRLLASRDRCPFMVHLEVVETGLQGNDARLYASGAGVLGATVQEVMGMKYNAAAGGGTAGGGGGGKRGRGFAPYGVPDELLWGGNGMRRKKKKKGDEMERVGADDVSSSSSSVVLDDDGISIQISDDDNSDDSIEASSKASDNEDDDNDSTFPRGGYQTVDDEENIMNYNQEAYQQQPNQPYNTHEQIRQEEIEEWHNHMQQQERLNRQQQLSSPTTTPSSPSTSSNTPYLTRHTALTNRVFGPPWSTRCEEIRQSSPYGHLLHWKLASFILKAGEDIRREALVMQVISKLNGWFQTDLDEDDRPYLRPYSIMCVGVDAGLLECVPDAKSLDEVKKLTDGFRNLRDFFERAFGKDGDDHQGVVTLELARDNFLRSLVGYSLVCYVLQIKDRHNANIMIDREGHLLHIDFGYVFGDTPKMGKVPIFSERAPFKLTSEFWDVIGGWKVEEGGLGGRFCRMFEKAFECASNHGDEIASLIESAVMGLSLNSGSGGGGTQKRDANVAKAKRIAAEVRERLRIRGEKGGKEQQGFILELVTAALTSWHTSTYDWLQKSMNGYR